MLSKFDLWYRKGFYLTHPLEFIEEVYLKSKWIWQRGMRGYADCDVWNLDCYLSAWMPEALEQLRKSSLGCPVGTTPKLWDVRLKRIIDGFLTAREMSDMNYSIAQEYDKLLKRQRKCFKMFSYFFCSLWD